MNISELFTPFKRQVWSVSAVLINIMGLGMIISYPSSLLPGLRSTDSPIQVNLDTASLLASSVILAAIPGYMISAWSMDYWGRKRTYSLVLLPAILGWLLISLASNIFTLLIGRILCSLSMGATTLLSAVIIGEYSTPRHRGMFLNLKTTAFGIGGMITHILGNYYTWRNVALFSMMTHVIPLLITLTWPESPVWLASKKQFQKCRAAFFWLRGNDEKSLRELDEMIRVHRTGTTNGNNSLFRRKVTELFKMFRKKQFLKPMFIIFLGAVLLEVAGRHYFPAYALDIVGTIVENKSHSFYYTLAIDIMVTSSMILSSILVKFLKIRTLLLGTGLAALGTLIILCVYLFVIPLDFNKNHSWICILFLALFFIIANLGCTPLPLLFMGELLPLDYKAVGTVISGIILSLGTLISLQVTPYMLNYLHVHGTFIVFGVCMGVVFFILYFILPETKDKTLQEIENFFTYGRYTIKVEVDDKNETEARVKMLDITET